MAKKIGISLSDDLYAAGEILRERRHYRTWSEYVASFVRHDATVQAPTHSLTEPIAAMRPELRDEMDAKLLDLVKSGKGERGSWLKKKIYDAIREVMADNGGKEPSIKDVEDRLPSVVVKSLQKGD